MSVIRRLSENDIDLGIDFYQWRKAMGWQPVADLKRYKEVEGLCDFHFFHNAKQLIGCTLNTKDTSGFEYNKFTDPDLIIKVVHDNDQVSFWSPEGSLYETSLWPECTMISWQLSQVEGGMRYFNTFAEQYKHPETGFLPNDVDVLAYISPEQSQVNEGKFLVRFHENGILALATPYVCVGQIGVYAYLEEEK